VGGRLKPVSCSKSLLAGVRGLRRDRIYVLEEAFISPVVHACGARGDFLQHGENLLDAFAFGG